MELHEWIKGAKGRGTALAAHEGVDKSAVTQWLTNGVPVLRMRSVSAFTRGAVTVDRLLSHRERVAASRVTTAAAPAVAAAAPETAGSA